MRLGTALAKKKLLNDPKHWRDRAEEARVHAEQMRDPEACRMMLEIAAGYERLAKKAEQRLLLDASSSRYRPSDAP
jgi:hypothetical protein